MHRTERDPADLRLDAALDAWRRDVSTATPRPALAERVLAAVARGDDEAVIPDGRTAACDER